MRPTCQRLAWVVAVVLVAALTPSAQAQRRLLYDDPPPTPGPSVRVSVNATFTGPGGSLSIRTTARVPDGGTASLGSYNTVSESRSEYGAPILGKVPVVNRGFRNVGAGRSVTSRRVTATVRVIDLREEEFRQTGFRSR